MACINICAHNLAAVINYFNGSSQEEWIDWSQVINIFILIKNPKGTKLLSLLHTAAECQDTR